MSGCALVKPDASQADRYLLRARYEQGVCFGRCPIYALNIYDNGLVTYEGERFTDKEGTWQKVLSRAEFTELMDEFEAAGFAGFPKAFPSNVADMSTKRMSYTRKSPAETFTTSWKENAAPKLEKLASRMRTIAESQGYKMYSEEVAAKPDIFGNVPQQPTQELIIQLENGVNPEAWAVRFNTLNLRYKSKVTPNGNYYLFDADPNRMNIEDLLDIIRRDEKVLGAQTNKEVKPRGGRN